MSNISQRVLVGTPTSKTPIRQHPKIQADLPNAIAIAGDFFFIFLGLCTGYWLRFRSHLIPDNIPFWSSGQDLSNVTLANYLPLLIVGTTLLLVTFSYQNLYRPQHLLHFRRVVAIVVRSSAMWLLAYLGLSLALKFEPQISRIYVAASTFTTTLAVLGWRYLFHWTIQRSDVSNRVRQRVVFLGWNNEAKRLAEAIPLDKSQPYQIVSCIPTTAKGITATPLCKVRTIGDWGQLSEILSVDKADMLILVDLTLKPNEIIAITNLCERMMVQFKIMPSVFQILISGLTLETISGIPILGVEELPLEKLHNRLLKRFIDLLGALVGLVISAPLIAVFGCLIWIEDKGEIFFSQERVGRFGGIFKMYKLRSMKMGAEKTDSLYQSTQRKDPRVLRIGNLIRHWNIDEVPQFWNVLKGDMSLVGPRPERPYHSMRLAEEIPHYNARYGSKPGMTGWAQINGLRGETDLAERVRYDLFYLENWNVWLDFQIMFLTFFLRKNAY